MPTRPVRTFTVLPRLPERLKALQELAYNLWWCWHADAWALFRRIDPERFESLDHSPIRLLNTAPQERFDELVTDEGFLAHLDRVYQAFTTYMKAPTWFGEKYPKSPAKIAYFSAEFGINESVPVYSGGLGVLAGDHLKSASDLGLPLTGVCLMYREGYFRQYLNADGWQQERYPENDFFSLPLIGVKKDDGSPLTISVSLPGRELFARVWRIDVGRVPLYLLDTNIPQNSAQDRNITAQLYGGDENTRIQQEIVLGIGGLRALRAMGIIPTVCHMNEGHSAFAALERARVLIEEKNFDFATAIEAVKAGTVFTTHTPVPAGNDAFPPHMMDQYFSEYLKSLKLDRYGFMALGRENPQNDGEKFSMTVLALHTANVSNGVSKLHGVVSRKMWKALYPELPEQEVPITSITNGVHTLTWVAPEIAVLFDRYLGSAWQEKPTAFEVWAKADNIPDAELWRTHERCRERLVAVTRVRQARTLERLGAPRSEVQAAEEILDPQALTIGFARRFATYKRGALIFRKIDRLLAVLNHKDRPVQLLFAGKAHPKDQGGKELIAQVAQYAKRNELRRKVVFLEDYDMNVARYLVQGVDVWLNNPRRPLEASGTSGMKVCVNGGINLSILDGWWDEGYRSDNGWKIGSGEELADTNYQDELESNALYELIEREIVPEFYTRGADGLPRAWIKRMKRSISTNVSAFNTNRMVSDYTQICYMPSQERYASMSAGDYAGAKELATWRRRLNDGWKSVKVEEVTAPRPDSMHVGDVLNVKARVQLGSLTPADVEVQLYHGVLDNSGDIMHPKLAIMETSPTAGLTNMFGVAVKCQASGQYGFTVRVLPKNKSLPSSFEPGLVTWG
ncbi:alpha-glucan family phosphorylase [Zavarzinella formosa]|uniref:alpha-glucan family phosphorylase n=1 Tax=Zavarzinella formosa TaxID=360055 RepID=UPI000301918A|nr:alpha-glucan family phosphorylase [Zavarzinella formosa]